jgi:SNF2 family DNA or RNA helicase
LIQFDSAGSKLYKSIANEILNDLDEAMDSYGASFDIFSHYGQANSFEGADALRGKIMSKLTSLRMLCDHPELLQFSAESSGYVADLKEAGRLDKVTKSPKLSALKEYVDNFLGEYEGNKIVIFTSYVHMVDIIRDALVMNWGSTPYTGEMNAKDKEQSKLKFQTDPDVRVLVSSDAGGYGVDLPQANLLINYDLPWNAGLAVQRNGRIRRASSTWTSIVIQDFLMEGSIEERQHTMLQQKIAIANAVIDGEGIDDKGGVALTAGSLKAFLQNITV